MNSLRLLVVDDDPIMPNIAKAHYLALGVNECITAADGFEAMEQIIASEAPFDMVLCDISMPNMDGVQLISALAEVGFKGWIAIISSQPITVCRTAMSIAESYGMKLAGQGRKPVCRDVLEGFLTTMQEHQAKATPINTQHQPMSVAELNTAIEEERVVPFYQPIIDLETGRIIGAETLARIENEDGSIVPPYMFIKTAEQSGLLDKLTRRMFNIALEDLHRINAVLPDFNMAINWDPKLLERKGLPDGLQQTCQDAGISPHQITLEITETTAFEASPVVLEVLVRLRLKGFGIAVDDYGTGYSNVDRLKRMPFSKLKIDQSFVRKALEDNFSLASVETAIRLATELNIPTVVEGVENDEHWTLMKHSGATQAQGYLISRPLPIDRFMDFGNACNWQYEPHKADAPKSKPLRAVKSA